MDGITKREVRGSSSRVGHRAGIGRISAGREHPRSWLRYQLLYDMARAAGRVESQGSTDVLFAEGLTRAKKSWPAHFEARMGRGESVHASGRGRGPGQDHARSPRSGANRWAVFPWRRWPTAFRCRSATGVPCPKRCGQRRLHLYDSRAVRPPVAGDSDGPQGRAVVDRARRTLGRSGVRTVPPRAGPRRGPPVGARPRRRPVRPVVPRAGSTSMAILSPTGTGTPGQAQASATAPTSAFSFREKVPRGGG
jgi:hypothetical protein